ncbi:MAG TPA: agmatinase [Verrucomicrobia bacterium]|nr:agmatinase [Verrucomicrobiota bacterium]
MKRISFLDVLHKNEPADRAHFHVIPAPMETTVCYGGGTAQGPMAILEASRQLDDFDGRRWPTDLGIHTQPFVKPAPGGKSLNERWIAAIEKAVARALHCGAIPAVLGGEHTATLGSARAFQAAGENIGFIHFDAHADLRDTYKGTKFSHACVLRRVHELGFPLVQVGTRAVSREEADYRAANEKTICAYDARVLAAGQLPKKWIPKNFPKKVFITFDLDGFDPAVIPATGTPVPGGFGWRDALKFIDDVAAARKIVGFDVLELAPIRGLHHPDYTAALLVYALMAAAARS